MGPADQLPDGVVKTRHSKGDHEHDVVTAAYKEGSRDEDNCVFVEVEDEVDEDEDLLVIVVELVGSPEGVLFPVPPDLPVHQRLQRLPVQLVASNHRQV